MSLSENESPERQTMQHENPAQVNEEPFTPCLEDSPLKEPHEEGLSVDPVKEPQEDDLSNKESVLLDEKASNEEGVQSEELVSKESESLASKNRDKSHRQYFDKFLADLGEISELDNKLQFAIDFMESSLSQSGTPHFKSFWEARTVSLELFKEAVSPPLRAILWFKYNELSKEARRLKEILDEQSAFAVEQIEIAIKALEDDITSFDEQLKKMVSIEFSATSRAMVKRLPHYQKLQSELNLLNTQASRINALRKELIRTEMRVRQKNKFFQRLSAAGDNVFPHRKELIKDVSQSFIADVDGFIDENFKQGDSHESLFSLREEIKSLQNMAKVLTLNTHSFTHTRMRLSECWDHIKGEEKERKKERTQQKNIFKKNVEEAMERLQAFNLAFQENELSPAEANKQLDEIFAYKRGLELGRDEQRYLREELNNSRRPILEKIQAVESQRHQQENERETARRDKIQGVKSRLEELLKNETPIEFEALSTEREELVEAINSLSINKAEKMEFDRLLKQLKDLVSEKKESSILLLSDDDRQALQQLKEILGERKERRQEIKNQIEVYRKSSGASGLDFEQAMNYNAQMASEKERLEKIQHGIKEVEQKIAKLEKR